MITTPTNQSRANSMFNIRRVILPLFLSFTFVGLNSFGQANFYLKANDYATEGKPFQISFVLENAKGSNLRLPTLTDFDIVQGPHTSSSFQWTNGKASQTKSWTYVLIPKKNGKLTIPSASIEIKNKSLTTKPLTVLVEKSDARPNNNQTSNNKKNASSQSNDINSQISENLFVRLLVNKNKAYIGEQVTATLKLYTNPNLAHNTSIVEQPKFDGFWVQEIEIGKNNEAKTEQYDGKNWKTYTIGKYALFPTRHGELTMTPIKLESLVRIRQQNQNPRSVFDAFFSNSSYKDYRYRFNSPTKKFKVLSLPSENKPTNFSGGVGKYKLEARIDSTNVEAQTPINLKLKISGTGNIMLLEDVSLNFPPGFEVYDPQKSEYVSKKSLYVNGSKTYEYLVVPQIPGNYKINPVQFSYFDLRSKSYKTLQSPEFNITVTGDLPTSFNGASSVNKANVEMLSSDIRYINIETQLVGNDIKPLSKAVFLTAYFSPFLCFLLFISLMKRHHKSQQNTVLLKHKKAGKEAKRRLVVAHKYMKDENAKGFYKAASEAFYGFVSDKFNIPTASLSRDTISQTLKTANISEETINNFTHFIDDCEMALFASNSQNTLSSDYEKASNLLTQLQDEIK